MKYQVLARKYRPHDFEALMGQEHVRQALENALKTGRLHHAYLFSGTRGVGKTTIARVLAKALNCEQGVNANPCGQCDSCIEIDQGRFVDLIEVDAASRTKVEDTRELLENVQYGPARGRYKIYLIDEVHMLSGHSFNALLKTLEEPPEHVKFLLATTDPQKLPVTVLSRCLKFNLKRLSIAQISQQLENILAMESLEFEVAALKPIAIAADGSMRDALSLLDQAIAFGAGKIVLDEVQTMLGNASGRHVFQIITSLAEHDANKMVNELREIIAQGMGIESILAEIINILQQIALCQLVPEAINESHYALEELQILASKASPEDIQLFYQIALTGRQDLETSPFPQSALEMILLRMLAFRPVIKNDLKTSANQSVSLEDKKKNLSELKPNLEKRSKQTFAEKQRSIPKKLTQSLSPENKEKTETKIEEKTEKKIIQPAEKSLENDTIQAAPPAITQEPLKKSKNQLETDIPRHTDNYSELPPIDAYYGDQANQYDSMDYGAEDYSVLSDVSPTGLAPNPLSEINDSPLSSSPTEKHADRDKQEEKSISNSPDSQNTVTPGAGLYQQWHDWIKEIDCNGLEREILMHSSLLSKNEEKNKLTLKFGLDGAHKELLDDKIINRLKQKLNEYFKTDVKIEFSELSKLEQEQFLSPKTQELKSAQQRLRDAQQAFQEDPAVNLILNSFAAKIIHESIKPL